MTEQSRRRLDSWKEIAEHFGRTPRTVMRWEARAGMPVHRVPGARPGQSVFAYTDELDRWLSNGKEGTPGDPGGMQTTPSSATRGEPDVGRQPRRPLPQWAVALPAGAALGMLGWLALASVAPGSAALPIGAGGTAHGVDGGSITRIAAANNVIVGRNGDAEALWTYRHPLGFAYHDTQDGRVIDLDGSGPTALLAVDAADPARPAFMEGGLYRFSGSGELEWRRTLDDELVFGAGSYGAPWLSLALEVVTLDDQPAIAWSTHHFTWWPSILVLMDAAGNERGKFVNAGWIQRVNVLHRGDADLLLAGGVSNSRAAAMLAVLDGRDVSGASPEDPGSEYECLSCAAGKPLRYLVFPPTDLSRAVGRPYNEVALIDVTEDRVNVTVREGPRIGPGSNVFRVYELSHEFELVHAHASDDFWSLHRSLRLEGKIDHPEAACPHHQPPAIGVWTADRGWAEQRATSR